MKNSWYALSILIIFSACKESSHQAGAEQVAETTQNTPSPELKSALTSITADNLLNHINVLASDAYEGRAPGTRGEDSTVAYLTRQFKKMGL